MKFKIKTRTNVSFCHYCFLGRQSLKPSEVGRAGGGGRLQPKEEGGGGQVEWALLPFTVFNCRLSFKEDVT